MIESVVSDLRYAARTLCKSPCLTLTIVISIGLGIAANTTIFSMINELLLRDMPVRDPEYLSSVVPDQSPASSYAEYVDFRDQSGAIFEGLAAHSRLPVPANISDSGRTQRVWGQFVSGNWFSLTGVPVCLGRGILPAEDEAPGRDAVIVLGHSLWQKLGADRSAVGRKVVLSGTPYVIVGVTAPGFFGLDRGLAAEFWIPLSMRATFSRDLVGNPTSRDNRWLGMTGRMRPGVSREQATALLNVIYQRMVAEHEAGRTTVPVELQRVGRLPIFEDDLKRLMSALAVVVGLVLLIACANVANLLLARAEARRAEIMTRIALGASRGRVVRQLLTESVLLACIGAAAGFLLSVPGTAALARLQPPLPIPIRFDFSPDTRVLAFTAALAVFTGILFGLVPAVSGSRTLVAARFRRSRMSRLLVGLQVTFSVVLLLAAGLFLRSLQKAASVDIGMKSDGLLVFSIDTKGQGYSEQKSRMFFRDLQARVEAVPGIESMSYVDLLPLSMVVNNTRFLDDDVNASEQLRGYRYRVGPRFFQASGIPLLSGRDFDPTGDANSRVAIINQAMADRLFGKANPIGRHIRAHNEQIGYEVIGLAGNMKVQSVVEADKAVVFLPLSDFDALNSNFGATVLVRTSGDASRMSGQIRSVVSELDADLPLFSLKPLSEHFKEALLVPRLCGALFATFGSAGLVLAVIGLFALVNYSVGSRTREIGIRIALGARPEAIVGMFARQGMFLVFSGLVAGVAVALAVTRLIASFLYGIAPTDWAAFTGVPVVLLAAAIPAIYLPARRAARVEPASALKYE